MAVALAYEQGFLRKEGLSKVQQWALSYYLVMMKRREDEQLKSIGKLKTAIDELSFITNPKLYDAVVEAKRGDAPSSEEESMPISASELGDFDKMLDQLDDIKSTTFSNLGEWV